VKNRKPSAMKKVMWTRPASVLLFLLDGGVNAQSAEQSSPSAQESLCFWAALAEVACSKLPEHFAQRSNCLEARAAQQKCLTQFLPEVTAGPSDPRSLSGAAALAPPAAIAPSSPQRPAPQDAGIAPLESSPERPVPQEPSRASSPESSADGVHVDETEGPPKVSPKASSANIDRPAVDDEPIAAIRADTSAKNREWPALGSGGIANETRTPLDNSRLVIAVIHSTSNVKDSPNTFEVRCRAKHTELALSTDGTWVAQSGSNIQVDYQINDWPTVRQPWILSVDGKTVSYNDDPVKLLRAMPNRATLRVIVADTANVRHEATFRLAGLTTIKRKIAAACGWPRATARRVHAPPESVLSPLRESRPAFSRPGD
jgi:hypothetical protein